MSAGAATLIAAADLLAYLNTFRVPFVFDDSPATIGNASIRKLWPPSVLLVPPADTTVSGRPVANFTFAVNYAVSGTEVWSYHAFNLLILVLGGVTLYGTARRTLERPVLGARFGRDAPALALGIALLWTLHPLQTEAVTYAVQRVESLMGLFYLLTLYCIIRGVEARGPRDRLWYGLSVASCLLGMGTKEVMVSAPLIALVYDRTFLAGSFREAWIRRRGLYLGLAATWVPLVFLVAATGWSRHGSAGFTNAVAPQAYWLTQFEAVARYLGLSVWPRPLVFDYGAFLVGGPGEAAPYAVVVVLLAALTAVGLWRRPALGFLGAWFFAILAPTCVIPVATQTMAEHRMYLPLAAVASLVAAGAYSAIGRRCLVPLIAVAFGLGILSFERNKAYGSERALWSDTLSKRPENARAHCSLGRAIESVPGELPHAISEFEEALRLHPNYADAHTDLGIALEGVPGRFDEALRHLGEAARLRPDLAEAHNNLGAALAQCDRVQAARLEYESAVGLRPDFYEARTNLGVLLCGDGKVSDGIMEFEAALRARPDYARAHYHLANALVQTGRIAEAIPHYEAALRSEPEFAEASNNLGMILCRIGRADEGMRRIDEAIRMRPDLVEAHFSRGAALIQAGRREDAAAEYEKVLQLRPNDPAAVRMLELIRTVH